MAEDKNYNDTIDLAGVYEALETLAVGIDTLWAQVDRLEARVAQLEDASDVDRG
jgi:hypothetical protein